MFCVLQLVTLFKAYFDGELNEASIKNNYVLIYELLDEVSILQSFTEHSKTSIVDRSL